MHNVGGVVHHIVHMYVCVCEGVTAMLGSNFKHLACPGEPT